MPTHPIIEHELKKEMTRRNIGSSKDGLRLNRNRHKGPKLPKREVASSVSQLIALMAAADEAWIVQTRVSKAISIAPDHDFVESARIPRPPPSRTRGRARIG